MTTMTATTLALQADPQGRVKLPKDFASAELIVERVGKSELRIRKAPRKRVASKTKLIEETERQLSPAATKRLIELLENPPPPTPALKRAIKQYKQLQASLRRPRRG